MNLPSLDDLKKKGIRKPSVEQPILETTRARPKKEPIKKDEESTENNNYLKKELIDQIIDENKDIDWGQFIQQIYENKGMGDKKTPRTNQPMKAIKEMMEDVFTVQHLQDLIEVNKKRKRGENPEPEEESEDDMNQMFTMFPMMEKMKKMGVNTDTIDPMWLMMLNANKGKGSSNLNQLFLMMAMMNMVSQAQPQQQITPNGKSLPIQGGVSPEMFQLLFNQLQEVMKQQETKPTIDPTLLTVLTALNKNQQNPKNDDNARLILQEMRNMQQQNQTQQLNLIVQNMNERFERAMETVAGSLNREPPETRLRQNWELLRSIQGDQRDKTDKELDLELKIKELDLKNQERKDMLAMEQREKEREHDRSDNIIDLAGKTLQQFVPQGIGQLIGEIATNVGKKGKKKQNDDEDEFDPTLLDVL